MRINGFTQIKAFYSWTFANQEKQIKPQHISLYLFLLNQNNRANWIEWFKCPFDLAMIGSCIGSKKTYYKCLNELQEWKLIQYKQGVNNWKAPVIKLEVLKDTSTVPQSEPQPTQADEPLPIPVPTHIYKLITDNKELIISNLSKWLKLPKSITQLHEDLFNSYQMIQGQARLHQTKEDEIKKHLTRFWLLKYEGKDTLHALDDVRNHFTNWLAKQDVKKYTTLHDSNAL